MELIKTYAYCRQKSSPPDASKFLWSIVLEAVVTSKNVNKGGSRLSYNHAHIFRDGNMEI